MVISHDQIHPIPSAEKTPWNSLSSWIDAHPRKSLITQVALIGIGAFVQMLSKYVREEALIKSAVQLMPRLIFTAALGLAAKTLWQWKHLFGQVAHGLLNIPYQANMSSAIYEPRQFKNSKGLILAELKYHQNLPILSFHSSVTDTKQRGYIEGLLLGDYIGDICRLGLQPMLTYLEWEKGAEGKEHLQKCIHNLDIPENTKQEWKGICEGFKERNQRQKKTCDLNAEWFLGAAHVLGDAFKAVGTNFACSAIVCKNDKGELTIGRNLDWPSMGYIGKRLLIRQYTVPSIANGENRQVNVLTFPGYVGALTAWNSDGLVVVINELGRISQGHGTPYSLVAKRLIEECSSVDAVKNFIQKIQKESPCASSVSIIVADRENAIVAQLYPENTTGYVIRDLKANDPLIVTNHYETDRGDVIERSICEPKSVQRSTLMKQACKTHAAKDSLFIVEEALKAAGVSATIGTFISNQSSNAKKIAFDNFSAHQLINQSEPVILSC